MTFKQFSLSEEIQKALEKLGYFEPTEVQESVIPEALQKQDLVVQSQTGSGKTAAFGIPICEMVNWEENKPQVLILTPTRELADQVKADITNIGRLKRVRVTALYGKQPFRFQQEELRQKCHVVVGTPGRVLDHIERGTLKLEKLACVVLDEADEMLNMGFIQQVETILAHIPKKRTMMLFSATMPAHIEQLSEQYMQAPKKITIASKETVNHNIEHVVYHVNKEEKFALLRDVTVIENPDHCIIFCNTKDQVDEVTAKLEALFYTCDQLHGGMTQDDRFAVMDDFKRGRFRYLIATDVAARGIDIDHISHVMNYDFPFETESYIHRVGRTGRAGHKGKAISFVAHRDRYALADVETYMGTRISTEEKPSAEAVTAAMPAFTEKLERMPKVKKDKAASVNEGIMKLYVNGGKKKKLRALDFVGTLTSIPNVTGEDIGIIKIQDTETYIDILNGKGPYVLAEMKNRTVKGKQLKVHKAKR
ncbi:MAG TPA: DEAD/DEAH box helicase [Sporosarcina sp.]|nr:DEAD/DEAH box helicase [Sporosarcina sp.]